MGDLEAIKSANINILKCLVLIELKIPLDIRNFFLENFFIKISMFI